MTKSDTAPPEKNSAQPKFPLFRTLLCCTIFLCCSCALNLLQLFINAVYVEPISVSVEGLSTIDARSVAVTLVRLASTTGTGSAPEIPAFRAPDSLTWTWNSFWIESIHLQATEESLAHIKSVTVQIGPAKKMFDRSMVQTWKQNKPNNWALPEIANARITCLTVPWEKRDIALNMPDLTGLLLRALLPGAVLGVTYSILLFVVFRHRQLILLKLRKLLTEPEPPKSQKYLSLELMIGLVTVIAGLAIQYLFDPYAFTQDDNFCQFLPVLMESAKTLACGHIPVWNPYQLLGSPTMSVGTYALTYLPAYASYWLAHWCGNDLATYEIFCNAHLLVAYFVTVWVLRRASIGTPLAVAGSVCWILSGWFLIGGRSQSNFVPFALFLPLLIDCLNSLNKNGGSMRWVAWTGLSVGILFHAGHAEFWAYTIMLLGFAVFVLTVSRAFNLTTFLYAAAAFALGLAIAAPLLVVQILETANISRQGGASWSVDLLPLILPLGPLGYSGFTLGSTNYRFGTELYYAGTIFTVVGIATFTTWTAIGIFERQIFNAETLKKNIWLVTGGLAFILCLGAPAILWSVLSYLPFFQKFRWSIKYVPFMQIFFIFAGATILERSLSLRAKRLVLGSCIVLMLVHCVLCRSSLYTFVDRSYPSLPPALSQAIGNGRIFTAAPFRSPTQNFVQSLTLNFPTAIGTASATGYDTFVSTKPEYERFIFRLYAKSIEAAKAYGLSALFCADTLEHPVKSGNPAEEIVEIAADQLLNTAYELKNSGHLIDSSPGRMVYALQPGAPLVFTSEQEHPLPFKADQAGIYVDTRGIAPGAKITVNFLCWPWMSASADGSAVPVKADEWERISLTLPTSSQTLKIEYHPPWHVSFAASALLGLVSAGLLFLAESRRSVGAKES